MSHAPWMVWLESMVGGTSRQSYAATFPSGLFHCVLDEMPMHLIPQHVLKSLRREVTGPVRLNPECFLCRGDDLPEELAGRRDSLSAFALQGTIAWVRDPINRSLMPFWLSSQLEEGIQNLNPTRLAVMPQRLRALLLAAGILIPEGAGNPAGENSNARAMFRERGYAPLLGLIHPFHVAALRRYYRQMIRSGRMWLGDKQSARRYVAHNDPVARFFHQNICVTLSALAGEALKPSYVYLASYLSGAELKKHTDREQCDFSVTLCLDFSPEPARETPWPIQFDMPTGTVKVYQALGDGLAYRGMRLPHYRSRLGDAQTSTSMFFHYVPENFAGPLD